MRVSACDKFCDHFLGQLYKRFVFIFFDIVFSLNVCPCFALKALDLIRSCGKKKYFCYFVVFFCLLFLYCYAFLHVCNVRSFADCFISFIFAFFLIDIIANDSSVTVWKKPAVDWSSNHAASALP